MKESTVCPFFFSCCLNCVRNVCVYVYKLIETWLDSLNKLLLFKRKKTTFALNCRVGFVVIFGWWTKNQLLTLTLRTFHWQQIHKFTNSQINSKRKNKEIWECVRNSRRCLFDGKDIERSLTRRRNTKRMLRHLLPTYSLMTEGWINE